MAGRNPVNQPKQKKMTVFRMRMMTRNLLAGHAVRSPQGREAETRKLVESNYAFKGSDS